MVSDNGQNIPSQLKFLISSQTVEQLDKLPIENKSPKTTSPKRSTASEGNQR